MAEPTSERIDAERATETKQEWHAPELRELGDLRTLTEAGGAFSPDGPATSAIS